MGTLDTDGTLNQPCAGSLDTGSTGGGDDSIISVSEQTISESVTVVVT